MITLSDTEAVMLKRYIDKLHAMLNVGQLHALSNSMDSITANALDKLPNA